MRHRLAAIKLLFYRCNHEEDHEIIGLPSASVIFRLYDESPPIKEVPKSIAVFADPVFEDDDPRIMIPKGKTTPGSQHPKPRLLARSASEVGLLRDDNSLPRLQATKEEA